MWRHLFEVGAFANIKGGDGTQSFLTENES